MRENKLKLRNGIHWPRRWGRLCRFRFTWLAFLVGRGTLVSRRRFNIRDGDRVDFGLKLLYFNRLRRDCLFIPASFKSQ